MISRLFLTLTLASSLSLAAAPETDKEFKLGAKTKIVTGLAVAATVATFAAAISKKSPELASGSVGLLTGLGCAAIEDYAQTVLSGKYSNKLLPVIIPISWMAGNNLRQQMLIDIQACSVHNVLSSPQANCARFGSWLSYLAYHGARYADNKPA